MQVDDTHTQYKVDYLRGLLKQTAWSGSDFETGYGAKISSSTSKMITYANDGVVLKDIQVYYKDQKGNESLIKTDIKIVLPKLEFSAGTAVPNLIDFSIVADEELELVAAGENDFTGDIYAGSVKANLASLVLKEESKLVVKNDILLENNAKLIGNSNSTIWAKSIIVDSAELVVKGVTHVSNDLNLKGTTPKAILQGIYNGYGNSMTEADKSSAILINGKEAILDMSNTNAITLAGHAYVGTKKNNTGTTDLTISETNQGNNVYMGESVAVKSDQLMYLVPGNCIGVSESDGISKYGKNPLTKKEYEDIINRSEERRVGQEC